MPQQSPLLDDYNQTGIVTPALQKALEIARQKVPQWQLPAPPGGAPTAAPRLQPPGAPIPPITRNVTPGATAPAPATTPTPQITDPDAAAHLAERDRLIKTGSGISQIHNPLGRGLLRAADVIGTAFAPRITAGIPGTELHHNYLVKQAEGAVDKDVTRAKENATTAETEQRTANEGLAAPGARAHTAAVTREANANAAAKENPPAKEPTNLLEWYRKAYPDKTPEDYAKFEQENKATSEKGGTVHQLDDGSLIMAHPDGTATPITVNGQPVKGKVTEKEPNQYADFKTDYLKKHPNADAAEIQREFKKTQEKPPEHGVTVIGPDNKVLRLEPGQTAPEGFRTPNQQGQLNTPTTQQRNVANQAQLVHDQTPYMLSEMDRLKDKLGPYAGRWNEVMQGKIGLQDEDVAGLRADLMLYSSAVALMHARGRLPENLREEFDQLINNPGQDFRNLKAIMTKIDKWTVANPGVKDNGGGNQLPGGISLDDINAEIERRKKK